MKWGQPRGLETESGGGAEVGEGSNLRERDSGAFLDID